MNGKRNIEVDHQEKVVPVGSPEVCQAMSFKLNPLSPATRETDIRHERLRLLRMHESDFHYCSYAELPASFDRKHDEGSSSQKRRVNADTRMPETRNPPINTLTRDFALSC